MALSNYSKHVVQAVAKVLVNFPGAGRLNGLLPSCSLKKYQEYHAQAKLLGPAPVGAKTKAQKRAIAALPQIVQMMRTEGDQHSSACERDVVMMKPVTSFSTMMMSSL